MGRNFVCTTFQLDVQYHKNSVKTNPTKSLVMSLENRNDIKTADDLIILLNFCNIFVKCRAYLLLLLTSVRYCMV